MRKITHIVVHCSDSPFGNVALIDSWHRERGMNGIGYNAVVGNAYPTAAHLRTGPDPEHDGKLLPGRDLDGDGNTDEEVGAHAYGFNASGLGICLIGKGGKYSTRQLSTLIDWIVGKALAYGVPVENVLGHRETEHGKHKTCPDLDMDELRRQVRARLQRAGR